MPHFKIDWSGQTATLFYGFSSRSWREGVDKNGNPVVRIYFSGLDCLSCLDRKECTKSKKAPRILTVRSQEEHEALCLCQRQRTDEFKQAYKIRAGCESVISLGVRTFGLRRSRYYGRKTSLQHILTCFDHISLVPSLG